MPMNEALKKLVEGETVDERMAIVEENQDLFNSQPTANVEETETKILEMEDQVKTLSQELEAQKQKYRDRFFGGSEKDEKPPEDHEEETKEVKSLEEILSNKEGKK